VVADMIIANVKPVGAVRFKASGIKTPLAPNLRIKEFDTPGRDLLNAAIYRHLKHRLHAGKLLAQTKPVI
jgi:hypothetical protein